MVLNTLNAILFSYACISQSLYFLIVLTILVQRRSSSIIQGSFFQLVITHYVADFFMFIEFNILMRGRKFGYLNSFFPEGSPSLDIVPRISTAIHYYLKIVVYIGQVVFAANRLTSAMYPTNYNNIWSRKIMLIIGLVQWTLPLAAVLPINLNMQFIIRYVPYPQLDTLRLENDPVSTDLIAFIDMGCSISGTLLSLGMYILIVHSVRKALKDPMTGRSQSTWKVEMRLLLSAFIVFIVLTFNTIIQIITVVQSKAGIHAVNFVNDLSYPVVDLIYTCQPWALILSSSHIRSHIFTTLRGRQFQSRSLIVTPSSFRSTVSRASSR